VVVWQHVDDGLGELPWFVAAQEAQVQVQQLLQGTRERSMKGRHATEELVVPVHLNCVAQVRPEQGGSVLVHLLCEAKVDVGYGIDPLLVIEYACACVCVWVWVWVYVYVCELVMWCKGAYVCVSREVELVMCACVCVST